MKKFFGSLVVLTMLVAPGVSSAQTESITDALERMDNIIKQMEALRAEFQLIALQLEKGQLSAQPTVLGASTVAPRVLTMDLSYGATNEDIAKIQRLLASDPEIYPYGVDSGFFGPKTQEAIRNLQKRFDLDPVGVIGPATTALLEGFFAKYPDENYPEGALSVRPTVLGASTANTLSPTVIVPTNVATTPVSTNESESSESEDDENNPLKYVEVDIDRGEGKVVADFKQGGAERFYVSAEDEEEAIEAVAKRLKVKEEYVAAVIDVRGDKKNKSSDHDKNDADDALDDADRAINDADDAIDTAKDDDEETEYAENTLDEAKDLLDDADKAYDDEDWDEAVKLANEAEDLAKKAEDRIGDKDNKNKKGDPDEIDKIEAEVDKDESDITVKYDNDDDYEFTVEEDKKDEIIDAVADELDLRSSEVEDLIEFDFGRLDSIDVLVDEEEGDARVDVLYKSGVKQRLTIRARDDEDRMIADIADELDERESRVEDVISFDYR